MQKNKNGKNIFLYVILLAVFLFPSAAYSHPHIFIDNSAVFVFGESGLEGIQLTWIFNEMFSSTFIHDYDENEDLEFSPKELTIIQNDIFSNLVNYDYFSHLTIDGKIFKVEIIKNFSARITEDEMVVYTFFIPCEATAVSNYKTVVLSVYDDTYYIAVATSKKDSVQAEGIAAYNYSYKVVDAPENPYYYGQIIPEEIIFKFKK